MHEKEFTKFVEKAFGRLPESRAEGGGPEWRSTYWAFAVIIPVTLYSFEALQISLFERSRAPNVSITQQLLLMLLFYGSWVLAPWISWQVVKLTMERDKSSWGALILRLFIAGLAMSAAHLSSLAIILRAMHSPPGWGPSHLAHSFGEVWLGYAGMWMIVYGLASTFLLLVYLRRRHPPPTPIRYQVRHNGRTLSVPLAQIYWVKAAGNYVELHSERGVLMDRKSLSQVAKELAPGGFLKSHRSALINGRHVLAIKSIEDGSSFLVLLSEGHEAPLSRRNLSKFKALLKTIE